MLKRTWWTVANNFPKIFTFCQHVLMKITSFVEICTNFHKLLKIFQIWFNSYTKICGEKGVTNIPVGLILLPLFAAGPYTHFCTKSPPGNCLGEVCHTPCLLLSWAFTTVCHVLCNCISILFCIYLFEYCLLINWLLWFLFFCTHFFKRSQILVFYTFDNKPFS